MYQSLVSHNSVLQTLLPQFNASYFLWKVLWFQPHPVNKLVTGCTRPLHRIWWQWRCGNRLLHIKDDLGLNGCDPPMDNLFLKEGRSVFEDHAEVRNDKYSWPRAEGIIILNLIVNTWRLPKNQERSCPDSYSWPRTSCFVSKDC